MAPPKWLASLPPGLQSESKRGLPLGASLGRRQTIIRVEARERYMASLEQASVDGDLGPFVSFVTDQMKWSKEMTIG
jgi:hypothetical protein